MAAAVEIDSLTAGYGQVIVVRDVSLTVDEGELVVLLGPNGAGKTTTLLAVSSLVRPRNGTIRILGRPTTRVPAYRLARIGLAHVPEDRSLFTQLSVGDNLRLARRNRRQRIAEAFQLFPELEPLLKRRCGLLSGGEQQMLAVARALLQQPRVLLVDEMSLGLAPVIVQRLLPKLADIAATTGAAVLFVEQHVQLALQVADRAYLLANGAIALSGAATDLRQQRELIESSYVGSAALQPAD
jgi:branched-chain amino acid transport system ATP-binding protein